uniref:(northern house mosquito) hypothetical protein n=1 Tax=Culex pipiens TaxID=7175 RepID=A0A8D8MUU2_CULPI
MLLRRRTFLRPRPRLPTGATSPSLRFRPRRKHHLQILRPAPVKGKTSRLVVAEGGLPFHVHVVQLLGRPLGCGQIEPATLLLFGAKVRHNVVVNQIAEGSVAGKLATLVADGHAKLDLVGAIDYVAGTDAKSERVEEELAAHALILAAAVG